jgi:hypothetical protein
MRAHVVILQYFMGASAEHEENDEGGKGAPESSLATAELGHSQPKRSRWTSQGVILGRKSSDSAYT